MIQGIYGTFRFRCLLDSSIYLSEILGKRLELEQTMGTVEIVWGGDARKNNRGPRTTPLGAHAAGGSKLRRLESEREEENWEILKEECIISVSKWLKR